MIKLKSIEKESQIKICTFDEATLLEWFSGRVRRKSIGRVLIQWNEVSDIADARTILLCRFFVVLCARFSPSRPIYTYIEFIAMWRKSLKWRHVPNGWRFFRPLLPNWLCIKNKSNKPKIAFLFCRISNLVFHQNHSSPSDWIRMELVRQFASVTEIVEDYSSVAFAC